jgi:alanyl-tRNA synthetase
MDSRSIRERFLRYFKEQGHQVVDSASLVPSNDPTLYFTNAGMVPFKDVFTGQQTRPYTRACSSQKCLRVSGKHNDLEAVGRTPKHHTFFEMLGNFSFGDYFKEDAIRFAWHFLTEVVALDGDRMVATVFGGDDGVPADEEAFAIWRDTVGLPESRIYRLGKADNFWSMGDSGPCGPCAEIHLLADTSIPFEQGLAAGGPAVDERWVEVWNLVFMQFDRQQGELSPLKKTGVDTGMGLERLTALKNGKTTTYDTDLFLPLIEKVAKLADKPYGKSDETDVSLRVVADHARATAFCIADGVFPEKGGREYVLRRIMRRAIRHGKLLGIEKPFFHEVCMAVVEQLGEVYDDLEQRSEVIEKLVSAEEASFRRTLDRGLEKLNGFIAGAKKTQEATLAPASVGDLYATDGFPVDLTRLIAEEHGLSVDEQAALEWVQKTHGAGETRVGDAAVADIYKQLDEAHDATRFLGYEQTEARARIVSLLRDGEVVKRADAGQKVEIVCDQTPFYARAGGQVGDQGVLSAESAKATISDTTKPIGALVVHQAKISEGSLQLGDDVTLSVDVERRAKIRRNHSATHLLHHALREVLGAHVAQKGSEVNESALRFDFSHFQAMTAEEIERVEQLVNAAIRQNDNAETALMSIEEAKKSGAMALFGEKYGDDVRVVTIGQTRELCGGTHVNRSGDIGSFRLISEESLAMGVRRVVAYTGQMALDYEQKQQQLLRRAAAVIKSTPEQLADKLGKLMVQLKENEREIAKLKKALATGGSGGGDLLDKVVEVAGIKVLATRLDSGDPKIMREAGDTLRDRLASGVLVLAGEHQGKATILVMVTKDLTKKVHAGKLVKELAGIVGGKGGGRPDMAQAGGPDVGKIDEAIGRVASLISGE